MLRRVLSCLAVTALTGAACAIPTAASADTTGSITVIDATVRFDAEGRSGTAVIAYTCADPDAVTTRFELQTALDQPVQIEGRPPVGFPEKDLYVTCDGTARTTTVVYSQKYAGDDVPSVQNGPAQVGLSIGSGGPGDLGPIRQRVTVSGVAPDPRATVKIRLNAHPEPTREGAKTVVDGRITRAGRAYAKKKAVLCFRPEGSQVAAVVKTVRASRKGVLRTKVRARESGTYFFVSDGTGKTRPGYSNRDHVEVVPARG